MRAAPLAILLLAFPLPALAAEDKKPAAPKDAPKLELPEPLKVEPAAGYVKVQAKASGPVSYFISAIWDNGTTKIQYDIFGGVLVLGIPNNEGLITIVASVNGAAGQPPIQQSTTVTVERKAAAARKDAPAAAVTHHATVIGTVDASKLEGPLAAAGVKLWVYAPGDARLAGRPDLAERSKALGGACVILSDAQGGVVEAKALPATGAEAVVLETVKKALGGK